MIKTLLFLLCKSSCSYANSLVFTGESSDVRIKARLPPTSRAFIGQATKYTTVKWLGRVQYLIEIIYKLIN